MVKHSYQTAFLSIEEHVAVIVDGKYTRVWFSKDGSTTVRQNTTGTRTKAIKGKLAESIVAFCKANLDQAK